MAERSNPFQSPDWDSNDAAALRAFLSSPSGKRFLFRLRNDRPAIVSFVASDCQLRQAGLAAGFEMCVNSILEYLTVPVTASPANMYPDLDDDTAWPADAAPAAPANGTPISVPTEPQPN